MPWRELFNAGAHVDQSLELGGYPQMSLFIAPHVEGNDPHGIPRDEVVLGVLVVKGESVDAIEIIEEFVTPLQVEGQDDFAV